MRKFSMKLSDAPLRLAALAAVGSVAVAGEADAAGTGVGGVAATFNNGLGDMGRTVLGLTFLGGLGMVGAGLLKLKSASDSQGREPYGPGIWRLAAGAGMVGLTAVSSILRDTVTGGQNTNQLGVGSATFN